MNRELELELLDSALAQREQDPHLCAEDETLIPVERYRDPARFEAERGLFRCALNLAALSTQLPAPGDFVTKSLVGTPTLIVRGEDGRARAFVNVCRHRGATVERRQSGRCKTFVCPYHAWTYGNDGRLCRVRHAEGFPSLDIEATSLIPLSCEERGGFIWVCPDPSVAQAALDQDSCRLVDELAGLVGPAPTIFASEEQRWHANWKLIVDGGLESYHFRIAHKDTISLFFGDTDSSYAPIGEHIRSVLPRRTLTELPSQPRSDWRLREHANLLYTIFPNAMILVQRSHFELILSEPLSPDSTRIEIATVGRAPGDSGYSEQARQFLEENHAFTLRTLREDFELAEEIQRGVGTPLHTHFRFARFEGALTHWHRRLEARLSAAS